MTGALCTSNPGPFSDGRGIWPGGQSQEGRAGGQNSEKAGVDAVNDFTHRLSGNLQ
jgi:hypothetical protein